MNHAARGNDGDIVTLTKLYGLTDLEVEIFLINNGIVHATRETKVNRSVNSGCRNCSLHRSRAVRRGKNNHVGQSAHDSKIFQTHMGWTEYPNRKACCKPHEFYRQAHIPHIYLHLIGTAHGSKRRIGRSKGNESLPGETSRNADHVLFSNTYVV